MVYGVHLLLRAELQAENRQVIMSTQMVKRQRPDECDSNDASLERCKDTAYMQASRTGRLLLLRVN